MIVASDPESVRRLRTLLARDQDDLRCAMTELRAGLADQSGSWTGQAAQSTRASAEAWLGKAQGQSVAYDDAIDALGVYAGLVGALRDDEVTTRRRASQETAGLPAMEISDDGVVTPHPDALPHTITSPFGGAIVGLDDRWQRLVEQYRTDHAHVSARADEVVAEYRRANIQLTAALDALRTFGGFDQGSAQARIASLTSMGLAMGLLPGSPSAMGWVDRAESNRAQAVRDLATARRDGDTETADMLTHLLAPSVTLLEYDPAHQHIVAAVGDLRSAKHVAVYVPGVEDNGVASAVSHGMNDIGRVWAAAGRSDTAVVYWKGYNNPGDGGILDLIQATSAGRAEVGGRRLAEFLREGLPATGGHSVTLLGHSYGSLVVGKALAVGGASPTNVVVFGSPGMGVESLGELHLRDGQFFAARAPDDWVANGLGGHGKDPASPDFGGIRLATNAEGFPSIDGHTDYLTAGAKSLDNIARVINGERVDPELPTPGDFVHATTRDDFVGGWWGAGVSDSVDTVMDAVGNGLGSATGTTVDSITELVLDAGDWVGDLVD